MPRVVAPGSRPCYTNWRENGVTSGCRNSFVGEGSEATGVISREPQSSYFRELRWDAGRPIIADLPLDWPEIRPSLPFFGTLASSATGSCHAGILGTIYQHSFRGSRCLGKGIR